MYMYINMCEYMYVCGFGCIYVCVCVCKYSVYEKLCVWVAAVSQLKTKLDSADGFPS